jgi:hypothetical protein
LGGGHACLGRKVLRSGADDVAASEHQVALEVAEQVVAIRRGIPQDNRIGERGDAIGAEDAAATVLGVVAGHGGVGQRDLAAAALVVGWLLLSG